jgi:hypothetical protein
VLSQEETTTADPTGRNCTFSGLGGCPNGYNSIFLNNRKKNIVFYPSRICLFPGTLYEALLFYGKMPIRIVLPEQFCMRQQDLFHIRHTLLLQLPGG